MPHTLIPRIQSQFPEVSLRPASDIPAVDCPPSKLLELAQFCKKELQMDMLIDLVGMDWGTDENPRFGCIYHLFSSYTHNYLRIATLAPNNTKPQLPSLTSLWAAADWHEREAYDLVGIEFVDHPDMRRILMWDGYEHHPLRKDFPLAGIEGDLPSEDIAESRKARVIAAPMQGGPFTAKRSGTMSRNEPYGRDESWSEKNPRPTNTDTLPKTQP